jgi:hypothetical protein
LGKFMARSRHYNRAGRGLEQSPAALPNVSDPDAVPEIPLPDVELSGDQPWGYVRTGKVRRARQLVQDRNYPTPDVVRSVAALLAKHLSPGE